MRVLWVFMVLLAAAIKGNGSETETIVKSSVEVRSIPLFPERDQNKLIAVHLTVGTSDKPLYVETIELAFKKNSAVSSLEALTICFNGLAPASGGDRLFDSVAPVKRKVVLRGRAGLSTGTNSFTVSLHASPTADLAGIIALRSVRVVLSNGEEEIIEVPADLPCIRFGRVIRAAGQDGSDTYRIPGMVTTGQGTLIAVYDVRYNNSRDLQDDIDVGMSRSTDGGQTWEPMRIIMDMKEWGGKPDEQNGVGDPCVLVDDVTGTIWVAALWLHGFPGQTAWNASGPGLSPDVTGQMLLVRSDDDGITWSEPINITSQIKDERWRLMFQGPGRGISLINGAIVFPAQYRDADGTPWSTIVWSDNHGSSWHIGTGARANTTEAQCVQMTDGSIMLNMRDNRNSTLRDSTNGRAVSLTYDMGMTWVTHPSSNSALREPVCMASLISADVDTRGFSGRVLFFSNPDNMSERRDMTIKTSTDEGMTWPGGMQRVLFEDAGFGYSCLTMIDENTIGILYEGTKELFFQKISVQELLEVNL